MTDWICFGVAFGIVVPWLTAGACLLAEWTCEALKHCWRKRTDPIYRGVEIQFRSDLAEAGLDRGTINVRSMLRWSSVLAIACFLLRDTHWLWAMDWLWALRAPMVVLEIAAILVAAVCLNLVTVSFAIRLRANSDPMDRSDTDDTGDCDDLLQAAEALSAQYEAIADGDRRRAGREAHRPHNGFGDESPRETLRLVKRDRSEP